MDFALDYSVYEKGKKSPQFKVGTDLSGEISLEEFLDFTKRSLIIIADTVLKEEQSKGFPKDPVVVVDGRKNKPIIDVSPLGKLQFIAKQDALNDIVLEIYDAILKRSPIDDGNYFNGNIVLYNGRVVATSKPELLAWAQGDEAQNIKGTDIIRFVNVLPYAGRLERAGIRAGSRGTRTVKSRDKQQRSGPTVSAPNGAYYLASRSARKKSKFNSKIYFEFIPGTQLGLQNLPTRTKAGKSLRKTFKPGPSQKYFGSYVYPSIRVIIDAGGIK